MIHLEESGKSRINVVQDFLLVSVIDNLDIYNVREIQNIILAEVKEKGIKFVLLDMSEVNIVDIEAYPSLISTEAMIRTLGASSVFTGFRAGVVSSLVDFNTDTDLISTQLNIDEGMAFLRMGTDNL